eukprot:tig00020553_g10748.t1
MPSESIVASPHAHTLEFSSSVETGSLAEESGAVKGRDRAPSLSGALPALRAAAAAGAAAPADADRGPDSPRGAESTRGRARRGSTLRRRGARAFRGAKRRLASWAAPFLSIRTLFIVSAVLQVISACGFTFTIMWVFGQRRAPPRPAPPRPAPPLPAPSADPPAAQERGNDGRQLPGELQERTFAATQAYLDTARVTAESVANFAATGKVAQGSWRGSLETFATTLARFSEISLNSDEARVYCGADNWSP